MSYMLHTKVKVELPAKKRELPQCKNCQQIGHTKTYCARQSRCVKYGLNHDTKACKKKKEDPAGCANCNGAHTANWKGCPVYQSKVVVVSKPKITATDCVVQKVTQSQKQKAKDVEPVRKSTLKTPDKETTNEQPTMSNIWKLLQKMDRRISQLENLRKSNKPKGKEKWLTLHLKLSSY